MKILDKIALVLFSNLVIIICVVLMLMVAGWLNITPVAEFITYITATPEVSTATFVISIVLILLSLKCIFSDEKNKIGDIAKREGILLANEDGKLLISKETLENLVINVVQGFEAAQNAQTKIVIDEDSGLTVFLTLFVEPNTTIKELSSNLQTRIKEEVKKSSDLDVKEINITVKNIVPKQQTSTNRRKDVKI